MTSASQHTPCKTRRAHAVMALWFPGKPPRPVRMAAHFRAPWPGDQAAQSPREGQM